ncbi:MAG: transposase [Verrucomicrobiia bacterium]
MKTAEPHSNNLRTHRLADTPATFFVTKCLQPRQPALVPSARKIIRSTFRHSVVEKRIALAAFLVMPDHWHGLFALLERWTLPRFMHAFMSFVGGKTVPQLQAHGCHWQDGYYETRIRSAKQFAHVSSYIVWNPVRRGLVDTPEQWDATSLRTPEIVTHLWPWDFEQD